MTEHAFPPVVYAPTRPSDGAMEVELQLMADGRRGLFVYSAIDRLQGMYGAPGWVALTVEGLQALHDESPQPYDLIFLDRTPHVVGDAASDAAEPPRRLDPDRLGGRGDE